MENLNKVLSMRTCTVVILRTHALARSRQIMQRDSIRFSIAIYPSIYLSACLLSIVHITLTFWQDCCGKN